MTAVAPDFVVRKLHIFGCDAFNSAHNHSLPLASTSDAGNDPQIVSRFKRCLQPIAVANIFLAHKNVHEVPKFRTIIDMLAQIGVLTYQVAKGGAYGLALNPDLGIAPGICS